MGHSYFGDELVVELVAGPAVGVVADDPHFRLPTQPKVVTGWEGTGEAVDPHVLVEGEGEDPGVVTHESEGGGGGGGDTPGGEVLGSEADEGSGGHRADSEGRKEGKKRKKRKKRKKGKKERRQVGVPKIAKTKTRIAHRRQRNSRGQWSEESSEDKRQES